MKTLAIPTRRPDAGADDFERLGEVEIQAVWRGMAAGIVRAVHGLADGPGAALGLETVPRKKPATMSTHCRLWLRTCCTCRWCR